MNERQINLLKIVIEMIEDGAYRLAVGVLTEMTEDSTGEKGEQDFAEIMRIVGRDKGVCL
jgi:hypothetical protein